MSDDDLRVRVAELEARWAGVPWTAQLDMYAEAEGSIIAAEQRGVRLPQVLVARRHLDVVKAWLEKYYDGGKE